MNIHVLWQKKPFLISLEQEQPEYWCLKKIFLTASNFLLQREGSIYHVLLNPYNDPGWKNCHLYFEDEEMDRQPERSGKSWWVVQWGFKSRALPATLVWFGTSKLWATAWCKSRRSKGNNRHSREAKKKLGPCLLRVPDHILSILSQGFCSHQAILLTSAQPGSWKTQNRVEGTMEGVSRDPVLVSVLSHSNYMTSLAKRS